MMDAPTSIPMPAKAAQIPPTFEKVLADLIKRATSPNDPIRQEFRDGDAAHLKRWLDYGGANKTWKKISKRQSILSNDPASFVRNVLGLRQLAATSDALTKAVAALQRVEKPTMLKDRKRLMKMRVNSEISDDDFLAGNMFLDEFWREIRSTVKSAKKSFPSMCLVRSDESGTRPRTIFLRCLSSVLFMYTGRWHDAEVAELCEIALGCDDVKIDMVRSARRESTRKSRPRKKRQPAVGGVLDTKK